VASCKWRGQGGRASKVTEQEMGISVGRRRFGAVSQHVLFALIFAGAAHSLGGVKQHADRRSEKVRWSGAWSASESKVSCGKSVRRFPVGFAGAVQAAFGTLDGQLR